jgi:hypothetical protein
MMFVFLVDKNKENAIINEFILKNWLKLIIYQFLIFGGPHWTLSLDHGSSLCKVIVECLGIVS